MIRPAVTDSSDSLRDVVASRDWYHTIELAPGVVTRGWFDLRPVAGKLPWPDLTGRRCLDVGTFDGFWAFEMERRGAAEVVAADILDPRAWDWPAGAEDAAIAAVGERKDAGQGFEIAREALGSSVQRLELSVYDLDPDEIGMFDVVYLGSLLLHLRDPVAALARVRAVCRERFLLLDAIDLATSLLLPRRPLASLDGDGRPWWWRPNAAAVRRMAEAAGFTVLEGPRRVLLPPGEAFPHPSLSARTLRSRVGREYLFGRRVGSPHVALLCRP
jgi:tRNA (mo5U34)-methyltransferase